MQGKFEYPERTADHGFGDLIGIVKPLSPIKEPIEARAALQTIREHLQLTASVLREGEAAFTDDGLNCIAHVLDCLHVGAGHVLEWVDRGQDAGEAA